MPFHCQTKPPIVIKTSSGDFKLVRKGTTYEIFLKRREALFHKLSHNLYLILCFLFLLDPKQY